MFSSLVLLAIVITATLLNGVGLLRAATTIGIDITTAGQVIANKLNLATGSNASPTSGDLWNSSGVLNFFDGSTTRTVPFLTGALSGTATSPTLRDFVSVKDYGAKGDTLFLTDGVMNAGSQNLASALATFTVSDIGKNVIVSGVGAAGAAVRGTISALVDSHNVTLSFSATTSVTAVSVMYGSDDTAGMTALRAFLRAHNPTMYTVYFPPGTYQYTLTNWLKGVTNVKVSAYRANLILTSQGQHSFGIDSYGCNFGGSIFSDQGDNDFDPSTVVNGKLIQTAAVGASSITLIANSDTSAFAVGNDVLIYGFEAQGVGYPPNPKYFEFNTITAINSGTGVITLKNPTRYRYDQNWVDVSMSYNAIDGAARIISLNRANFKLAQNIVMEGATFLADPGPGTAAGTNGSIDLSGARNITLVDVSATGIYAGESDILHVYRGTFSADGNGNGANEGDKVVSSLTFEDSTLNGHAGATGILFEKFLRSKLFGSWSSSARNQVYQENDIETTPANNVLVSFAASYAVNAVSAIGNRCYIPAAAVTACFGDGNQVTGVVLASPMPTSLTFSVPWSSGLISVLDVNTHLGTSGTTPPKFFIVTSFICDKTGTARCDITGHSNSGTAPAAGDTFYFWNTQNFISSGNINLNAADQTSATGKLTPYVQQMLPSMRVWHTDDQDVSNHWTKVGFTMKEAGYYTKYVRGHLYRIIIDVQRAYTGADATCNLDLANTDRAGNTIQGLGPINCKIAGIRAFNLVTNGENKLTGIASGTYTSGGSVTGTVAQTCNLSAFNNGNSGGTATVALTGTNTIAGGTAVTITNPGVGSTSAATSATLSSGTATCSGTATVTTVLGGDTIQALTSTLYGEQVQFHVSNGAGGSVLNTTDDIQLPIINVSVEASPIQ